MTAPLRPVNEPPPLPTVDGGFATVLADPPWRFANRTGKVAPEHRRLDRYSTLSLAEICALDVAGVVADNAHLYLWVPNALLPEGLRVMEDWGFRYVSNIVWSKVRRDGLPDGRGVGFYFRNTTELLLFGVRGSMRTLPPARSQVNQIVTRKREHSRKPDEQYDLIEACSPGPYLEMFGRYPQPNWVMWGDEANGEIAPRGQNHKGYAGGEITRLPALEPHSRVPQWLAAPRCQDCNQLVAEKQDLRDKLRSAYAVIAEQQQRLEDDERNIRAARRQLELFMDDGITERVTVALALLDESTA